MKNKKPEVEFIPQRIISGLKQLNPYAKVCYRTDQGHYGVKMSNETGFCWIKDDPDFGYAEAGLSKDAEGSKKLVLK